MRYKKLKRTWSHNDINYIPKFMDTFPELNKLSSEELCDRFSNLNVDFYTVETKPVSIWIRLTLPFAIIAVIIGYITLPIYFLFTGRWYYPLTDKNNLLNWFRSLRLFT